MEESVTTFETHLTAVMDSLIRASVCEITKLFQETVNDYLVELSLNRKENDTLKLRLRLTENKLRNERKYGMGWAANRRNAGLAVSEDGVGVRKKRKHDTPRGKQKQGSTAAYGKGWPGGIWEEGGGGTVAGGGEVGGGKEAREMYLIQFHGDEEDEGGLAAEDEEGEGTLCREGEEMGNIKEEFAQLEGYQPASLQLIKEALKMDPPNQNLHAGSRSHSEGELSDRPPALHPGEKVDKEDEEEWEMGPIEPSEGGMSIDELRGLETTLRAERGCEQAAMRASNSVSPVPNMERRERNSLSRTEWILGVIVGDNSEVEDLSDIDDPVADVDYQPPQQKPSSDEEDSSGDEDPVPQPTEASRGCKRLGYPSDRDVARARTPKRRARQVEAHGSNDGPEEPIPGPSCPGQPKKGRGMRWKATPLMPNLAQFEPEEETDQEREGWTPLDYVEQYIDKDIITLIVHCSNATSLAKDRNPLKTSVGEIYNFFGASILMSCVRYPQIRMYWSNALRFPAIVERFTRDRFFRLRRSLKVLIDDDIPEDLRECDKFWKVRPFLDRILKGCRSQARPDCVSIDEQMIPFTGACPSRQYLPMKPNPVGMKNFVCASALGIVLDFDVYQGADALIAQVQEPEGQGLGSLVMDRLCQTLHAGTKVYCDRFFTTTKCVAQMMEKQVYLTGTIMKNRVADALEKLPSDKNMKEQGRGTSAQVTTEEGKMCVVKWYDNKPVLMLSAVHDTQPEDTCQRWDKKQKQYVTITRPSIIREYNSKMGGVDLVDRMMSYYRMSTRTKKWTLRMLLHFTDLALANSWLLYRQDHTVRGTPRKGVMQFLEFRMEVAQAFLAQRDNDGDSDLSEQEDNADLSEPGKKRPVKAVPHISVRRRANAHLPEVVNLKNAARCRATGCSGKTRVQCVTCKVFLCLQAGRNCYTAFHT